MAYGNGGTQKRMSKIRINPAHKGMLHEDTGTAPGAPIPLAKEQSAANSPDPAVRKRAVFALNARKWNK